MTFTALLISNTIIAAALAVCAWLCERFRANPVITHMLWVATLIKLIFLPMIHVPLVSPLLKQGTAEVISYDDPVELAVGTLAADAIPLSGISAAQEVDRALPILSLLYVVWLFGSLVYVARWLVAWWRGSCVVRRSKRAPSQLGQQLAAAIGLPRPPRVVVTKVDMPPFVWCFFCRPVIVFPRRLLNERGHVRCAAVLLHEMAHIRRRDHWVRHLEWLATCLLWWHPLLWIAKHQIRQVEELCCDEYVLRHLPTSRFKYARALVDVVELFNSPKASAAFHSGMSPRTLLTRRVEMMLQGCIRSRRGHWAVVAAILACLPLSITLAGPFDKKKKTVGAAPIRRPAKGSSRVLRAPKNKELAIVRAVFFEANKEQLGSLNLGASSAGQLVVRKSDRWQAQFERVKRKLRILSVPHVAVVAGKPATIFVGQEVPILWLPKTKEVIASIPTGITAKVIATRQKDKKISLDLVLQIALAERTKAKRPRRKQLQTQVVTQRYLRTEAKVTSQTETLVVQLPAARGDKGFIVAAFTTIMLARGQKAVSPFGKTGQTRPATKTQPAKR